MGTRDTIKNAQLYLSSISIDDHGSRPVCCSSPSLRQDRIGHAQFRTVVYVLNQGRNASWACFWHSTVRRFAITGCQYRPPVVAPYCDHTGSYRHLCIIC